MSANLENSAVATGLENVTFHSNPKEGQCQRMVKLIVLISHASKVTLKTFQARLQQYINWELSDIQAGFRKGRGIRDQIASIHLIMEKARKFQKNIYFCFIEYTKAFVWITTNCGLFVSAGDSSTQTGKSGSVSYGVTRKGRFSFQPQKKGNAKEWSN